LLSPVQKDNNAAGNSAIHGKVPIYSVLASVFSVRNFAQYQKELIILPFAAINVTIEVNFDWKNYATAVTIPIIEKQYRQSTNVTNLIQSAKKYCENEEIENRRKDREDGEKIIASDLTERSEEKFEESDSLPTSITPSSIDDWPDDTFEFYQNDGDSE
jgi:hypothetical protein